MADKPEDDLIETMLDDLAFLALQRELAQGVVRGMVERGQLSIEELMDGSYRDKVMGLIRGKAEVTCTIDHTRDLLRRARRWRKRFREDAALYYALFIEHKVNGLIVKLAERSGISTEDAERLMRRLPLQAKASRALEWVGGEPFDEATLERMGLIGQARNAYVHYKWTSVTEDRDDHLAKVLELSEAVVRSIKTYEDRWLYGGRRSKVDWVLGGF